MAINADKPHLWKAAVAESVDLYNNWFMQFDQLTGIEGDTLLGEGRVYGGGVHKMEPKEMARVPVQTLADILTASDAYRGQRQLDFST
jgi:hypothetical protein